MSSADEDEDPDTRDTLEMDKTQLPEDDDPDDPEYTESPKKSKRKKSKLIARRGRVLSPLVTRTVIESKSPTILIGTTSNKDTINDLIPDKKKLDGPKQREIKGSPASSTSFQLKDRVTRIDESASALSKKDEKGGNRAKEPNVTLGYVTEGNKIIDETRDGKNFRVPSLPSVNGSLERKPPVIGLEKQEEPLGHNDATKKRKPAGSGRRKKIKRLKSSVDALFLDTTEKNLDHKHARISSTHETKDNSTINMELQSNWECPNWRYSLSATQPSEILFLNSFPTNINALAWTPFEGFLVHAVNTTKWYQIRKKPTMDHMMHDTAAIQGEENQSKLVIRIQKFSLHPLLPKRRRRRRLKFNLHLN